MGVEALLVEVEGVGVLHEELAAAQEAEAGADLVAELRADLVQVERELPPRRDRAAHHVGHGLLGRRRERELAVLAVLEVEEDPLGLVTVPATGLDPELLRLEDRQVDFQRARRVHLLADDLGHLPERPEPERRVRVDARGELVDESRAVEELMRDDLGVAGHLAESHEKRLGPAHVAREISRGAVTSAREASRPRTARARGRGGDARGYPPRREKVAVPPRPPGPGRRDPSRTTRPAAAARRVPPVPAGSAAKRRPPGVDEGRGARVRRQRSVAPLGEIVVSSKRDRSVTTTRRPPRVRRFDEAGDRITDVAVDLAEELLAAAAGPSARWSRPRARRGSPRRPSESAAAPRKRRRASARRPARARRPPPPRGGRRSGGPSRERRARRAARGERRSS